MVKKIQVTVLKSSIEISSFHKQVKLEYTIKAQALNIPLKLVKFSNKVRTINRSVCLFNLGMHAVMTQNNPVKYIVYIYHIREVIEIYTIDAILPQLDPTMMLLIGMNISFTKNPTNPITTNPIAVRNATLVNSVHIQDN